MTTDDQRIAIAEERGFVWYRLPKNRLDDRFYRMLAHPAIHEYEGQSENWLVRADGTEKICNHLYMWTEGHVPDYPGDWNSIHDAVNGLSEGGRLRFLECLDMVTRRRARTRWFPERIATSTRPEWCEAYLRAVDGWKD